MTLIKFNFNLDFSLLGERLLKQSQELKLVSSLLMRT